MTIAIGLISKRGIMLAADSQMSVGKSGFKTYDEKKVFRLKIIGGIPAAIAFSGDITTATYFREILDNMTEYANIRMGALVPKMISDAMKETRKKLLNYVNDRITTAAQRDDHLARHNFQVILGYYYANRPWLYTFSLVNGLPCKSHRSFEVIGSGGNIARFILSGGNFRDLDITHATNLAIYTIEICKKFNNACGGDFQHFFLDKEMHGQAIKFSEHEIERRVRVIKRMDVKMHQFIVEAVESELVEMDKDDDFQKKMRGTNK